MQTLIGRLAKAIEDRDWSRVDKIEEMLPSGGGINAGTQVDRSFSHGRYVVLRFGVFHPAVNGYVDEGWSHWKVIAKPNWDGIIVKVLCLRSGMQDRDNVSDYLYDVFYSCLTAEYKSCK